MERTIVLAISILVSLTNGALYSPYNSPNTLPDRQTMVHLFEWKWTDIANECETFLSKYGYGAVQISPPNEHLMQLLNNNVPWWIRYQPISYGLNKSRSGTEKEFIDMVNRCNKVGVRIIVDGVINHMCKIDQKYPGTFGNGIWSSAGSNFDGSHGIEQFPSVPYSTFDFHDSVCDSDIQPGDYVNNAFHVRTCRLDGLLDLDQSKDYVRQKITEYFNHVIDIGVAGVRIDAAKHMFPSDILAILGMVKNVNSTLYGPNKRPAIVQEVIDSGGEAIKGSEYLGSGRITNFNYGIDVAAAVRRQKNFKYFSNFGPGWAYLPDEASLVFIDNHDNQRDTDHRVLSYQADGPKYIMGVSYMLAWTYGYTRVMSSYAFTYRDQGPPNSGSPDWITTSPTFQSDEQCAQGHGWLCEHRLPPIRRMVKFRSVVTGEAAANIVTEDNRIAFRRGTKGFYALNNADQNWQRTFYTGMPEGNYCDVISGEYSEKMKECMGLTIKVDSQGNANISIYAQAMVAIHIGQRVPDSPMPTPSPLPASFKRTVIMVHKKTDIGQNLFVRGSLDANSHGCQGDSAATSNCSIPIVHKTNVSLEDFRSYLSWGQSDRYLDWFGGEPDQGTYDGILAQGTPLVWTTNKPGQMGYYPLNTYGDDYWLADLLMDCSKTDNGWFVFKGYLKTSLSGDSGVWENDINQDAQCKGDAATTTPSNIGLNHAGLCGAINVFDFGQNGCEIKHVA